MYVMVLTAVDPVQGILVGSLSRSQQFKAGDILLLLEIMLAIVAILIIFSTIGMQFLQKRDLRYDIRYERYDYDKSAQIRHMQRVAYLNEIRVVILLVVISFFSYFLCYEATYSILVSVQQNNFGPSETVQVISAVGGLSVAIGTS